MYREYEFPKLHSKDDFYAAVYGDDLVALIKAIVEKEGPIHLHTLAQRVAAGYSMGRVGEKIEEIVRTAVKECASKKAITLKHDFVWHGPYNPDGLVPRRPSANGTPRPVEFVAIEEMATAVVWILKRDRGVPRDSLVTSVARIMGYDRTGHNVEEQINKAIDSLLSKNRISQYEDQLILASDKGTSR